LFFLIGGQAAIPSYMERPYGFASLPCGRFALIAGGSFTPL